MHYIQRCGNRRGLDSRLYINDTSGRANNGTRALPGIIKIILGTPQRVVRCSGIGYVHRDPCPGGCGLYLWPEVDLAPSTRNFNWSLEALHVYVGLSCTMVEWQNGLEQKGLYYEGIVNGSRLDSVLELHRRSTVSTFGTRRSSRVSVAAQTEKRTNNENVRVYWTV